MLAQSVCINESVSMDVNGRLKSQMWQETTRGNRLEKTCVQHGPLKDTAGKHLTLTLCASLWKPIAAAGLQPRILLVLQKDKPKHTYWIFMSLGLQARPAHVNFPDSQSSQKHTCGCHGKWQQNAGCHHGKWQQDAAKQASQSIQKVPTDQNISGHSSLCHEDLSAIDGHQIIRISGEGKGVRIVDEFHDLLDSDILCKTHITWSSSTKYLWHSFSIGWFMSIPFLFQSFWPSFRKFSHGKRRGVSSSKANFAWSKRDHTTLE